MDFYIIGSDFYKKRIIYLVPIDQIEISNLNIKAENSSSLT